MLRADILFCIIACIASNRAILLSATGSSNVWVGSGYSGDAYSFMITKLHMGTLSIESRSACLGILIATMT